MKNPSFFHPFSLLGHFIPYAYFVSIPASACIGEVEEVVEVDIEIGFTQNAKGFVIVGFPEVFAVPSAGRTPMSRQGGRMQAGLRVKWLPGYSVIWLFGEDKRDFLLIAAILRHLQRYSTA